MTIDQAIQYSYMAPNILNNLKSPEKRLICKEIKKQLHQIYKECPQSEERDRIEFQYKHAVKLMSNN